MKIKLSKEVYKDWLKFLIKLNEDMKTDINLCKVYRDIDIIKEIERLREILSELGEFEDSFNYDIPF